MPTSKINKDFISVVKIKSANGFKSFEKREFQFNHHIVKVREKMNRKGIT
jgi:hypothetical protein